MCHQSLVAQRVSAGILTEEQARRHPERNVLLQALGVRDSVELALKRLTVHPMDILLLCSDGLHGQMTSAEMHEIISEAPGLDAASKRLIDLANSRGGPDNITTVLVEFLPARSMGFYQGIEDDESGLFDFNKGIKVDPSTIFNFSAGYSLVAGASVLRPELYIENVFNKKYLLKGAFFSGASVGRPRSIQLRMNLGI